jgi:hypothetical protein
MRNIDALRLSLLLAMGIAPAACGGKATEKAGEPGNEAGQTTTNAGSGPNAPGGRASGGSGGATAAGSGATAAGSGAAPSGGATANPLGHCTNAAGNTWGLVQCEEGYAHRPQRQTCGARSPEQDALPRATDALIDCILADGSLDHSKCRQYAYGYCYAPQASLCGSGCVTDEDCGTGQVCNCGHPESPTGGVCETAGCATDADCGQGGLCATYVDSCSGPGFACLSPQDECVTGSDCESGVCGFQSGHRYCENCIVGRPFLVEAETRMAPLESSNAWAANAASPELAHLSSAEREALARHWSHLGRLEHASIAAFARFQLQLLALGAPPALVEACTRAMADETAHAQICFDLAGAYAGRAIGPGKLNIEGCLLPTSLGDVVELVLAEGCFGETSATLEALDAAEQATDPFISATYARIARDEERHAALAFQFVSWAMQQEPSVTASRIAQALAAQLGSPATRLVVLPCLEALVATSRVAA